MFQLILLFYDMKIFSAISDLVPSNRTGCCFFSTLVEWDGTVGEMYGVLRDLEEYQLRHGSEVEGLFEYFWCKQGVSHYILLHVFFLVVPLEKYEKCAESCRNTVSPPGMASFSSGRVFS